MEFEWDDGKARTNLEKHKLAFEDAIAIFDDRQAISSAAKTVGGEERHKRTGLAGPRALLTVIYAWRASGDEEIARIISARPASRKERRDYGNRSI